MDTQQRAKAVRGREAWVRISFRWGTPELSEVVLSSVLRLPRDEGTSASVASFPGLAEGRAYDNGTRTGNGPSAKASTPAGLPSCTRELQNPAPSSNSTGHKSKTLLECPAHSGDSRYRPTLSFSNFRCPLPPSAYQPTTPVAWGYLGFDAITQGRHRSTSTSWKQAHSEREWRNTCSAKTVSRIG